MFVGLSSHSLVSCCSDTVLVLACVASQKSVVDDSVNLAVCCGAELLSLPELLGLQRASFLRSHRGELQSHAFSSFKVTTPAQSVLKQHWPLLLQVFLWPIGGIVMTAVFALLTNFNPTRFTLGFYFV